MAKVVLISGSTNPRSLTKRLLKIAEKALQQKGHETELICVGETNFPLYNSGVERTETMQQVAQAILDADAFVIGSPEYHGGYSGALKNLLDYQDGSGFTHKPVALLATTGGLKAGMNTLNSLRLVFRTLHSYVIPEQAAISEKELDAEGRLIADSKKQLVGVIEGLHREILLRVPQSAPVQ